MDLHFLCLTPGTSEIIIWLCPADTVGMRLILSGSNILRLGVVLQQKFQTLTSNFAAMLCLINSEDHVNLAVIFLK